MPDFDPLFQSALQHHRSGNLPAAVSLYQQAAQLRPQSSAVHNNLSLAFKELGDAASSLASAQTAVNLAPTKPGLWTNLGNLYRDLQNLDAATDAFNRSLSLDPNNVAALNNLSLTLHDSGLIEEAVSTYRLAVAIDPTAVMAHSNLLYAMHFDPRFSAQDILHEHKIWAARHADPLTVSAPSHTNDLSPDRPLKIGYVSPHLYDHVVGRFMLPLLQNHDRDRFHISCYTDQFHDRDPIAQKLRSAAHTWRTTRGLSDEDLAHLIRQDQIDILVDLTMHMSGSRLLAFARKPVPVQVTYLAYASTTGLAAMDYRLTDPHLDPPGTDANYTEKSIRLPDSFWCYRPLNRDQKVAPLPALEEGYITFSALTNFCKINPQVLDLWARVMTALPGSRILMIAKKGSHRDRARSMFAQRGVGEERVEFLDYMPRAQYLETYNRIDIGLDTFPYNGHTTSLDCYWMGVPVVTLVGSTAVSRAGWCQLSNLGLTQLAAFTESDFVRIAATLAADLPHLAALRAELRPRMERSPLMDYVRFTRNIESAFRTAWRTWCAEKLPQ